MSGRSTEAGFTLVELVTVLLLVGVLAAVAVPRLSQVAGFQADGWREQVSAGLRLGAATALGHRRLVCASVAADGVLTLRLASSRNALSCDSDVKGPDGQGAFSGAAGVAVTATPASFYFQPNGRVSSDAAGATVVSPSISAAGVPSIQVRGESGHVE